ncbi:unnamed protein product [Heterobilharzia americana]|nr:unnamed protein product [Heterobilharzia americana]
MGETHMNFLSDDNHKSKLITINKKNESDSSTDKTTCIREEYQYSLFIWRSITNHLAPKLKFAPYQYKYV